MVYHDVAPVHILVAQGFVLKKKNAVPHHPRSPNLDPCYFLLFPKMKWKFARKRCNVSV
jgi:hypothetical protein